MDTLSISNMAIGFVGGSPITSLDDKTVEADACRVNYEPARDYCLEQRDWTFASTRFRLTPLSDGPVHTYAYAFRLPGDCLAVRRVSDNADLRSRIVYEKDGRDIVCDSAIIFIRYTKRIVNTSIHSASFNIAVATKLAEFIAIQISADKVLKRAYEVESNNLLGMGGATDGLQGSPRKATASRLIRARHANGYGNYGLTKYI